MAMEADFASASVKKCWFHLQFPVRCFLWSFSQVSTWSQEITANDLILFDPSLSCLGRSLLFLIFGSILSGMAPWLLLGAICGEMMIWLALQLCQVIRRGSVQRMENTSSVQRLQNYGNYTTFDG